jgi:hypothetical protein
MSSAPMVVASPPSDSLGARLLRSTRPVRAGQAGALYDLVVTAGFATPWTAAFILGLLASVQDAAGLPGDPMPAFGVSPLLFVTLFGVVVTMWSVVRLIRPTAFLVAVDTVGRAVFATWFTWALLAGHSTVIVAFLALEVTFLVVQGLGVRRALRLDREAEAATARTAEARSLPIRVHA